MPKIIYRHKDFSPAHQAKIDLCNSIIEEYVSQGMNLTLRQLYYQLVARDYIPNKLNEYSNLGNLINDARMAGQIDWEHIIDRVRSLEKIASWPSVTSIMRGAARGFHMDRWSKQDYRVEVWVEKNAAVGTIEPVCLRLDVPYFACIGYSSATSLWEAAQRLRGYIEEGQTPVILHLGDHDPSGKDMTRDIRERLDLFLSTDCDQNYIPYDGIEVDRIALNMDQIYRYNPPPNPAKLTDSRAKAYIEEFGDESWELDALSPTTVDELIETAVGKYINWEAWEEMEEAETTGKTLLNKTVKHWQEVVTLLEGKE